MTETQHRTQKVIENFSQLYLSKDKILLLDHSPREQQPSDA